MKMTEALAELKTLTARLQKKREAVAPYLWRQDGLRDPMEKEVGGSMGHIQRERQAIADLEKRFVAIRTAIQGKNQTETLTVGDRTETMATWLNWRKEIAPQQQAFIQSIRKHIVEARRNAQSKGFAVVAPGNTPSGPMDILVNVDEKALADEAEQLENVLGTLDGQLSLKLATVDIEV